MDNRQITDTEAALQAGRELAGPQLPDSDGTPFVVLPPDHRVEDLEHLLENPKRIKEHVLLYTLDDFLEYLHRFGDSDESMIFADPGASTLQAVIDYHWLQTPRWCDHTLAYSCRHSQEWSVWQARSGKPLSLVQFAEHIEDNALDIREPAAAVMLEIGRGLEGKKSVSFKQVHRLQDGSFELGYEETVSAQTRNGNYKVPEKFTLALRPYLGSEPFAIDARLRYRVGREGDISITYDLLQTTRVLEAKFNEICETVKSNGWIVLQGRR